MICKSHLQIRTRITFQKHYLSSSSDTKTIGSLWSPVSEPKLLVDELNRTFPHANHSVYSSGWIRSSTNFNDFTTKIPSVAFAKQVVPEACLVSYSSPENLATRVSEIVADGLSSHKGPWRFHILTSSTPIVNYTSGRGQLRRHLLSKLKNLQGKYANVKEIVKNIDFKVLEDWVEEEALVQVAFLSSVQAVVSVCLPPKRLFLRRCISRLPCGIVSLERDKRPPSTAYLKLLEAEILFGRKIGKEQTVVELGASPGGWTWVCLERGAVVTAIDKAPLREDLMKHSNLTFVEGDAFAFVPQKPVDWLLCDVLTFPQNTIELLQRWVSGRLCKQFIVTIKFLGSESYHYIEEAKQWLDEAGVEFTIRKLMNNKNEVTIFGYLREFIK